MHEVLLGKRARPPIADSATGLLPVHGIRTGAEVGSPSSGNFILHELPGSIYPRHNQTREKLVPIRKGYVDVPEGQIHYLEEGEGDTILLLHQSPSSARMWENVISALAARGYRVIAIDYPGFGESYRPASKPDLDLYLRTIAQAATALGVEKFATVGHHTGATFAICMADKYPDRVTKAVSYGLPYLPKQYADVLAYEPPTTFSEEGTEIVKRWANYFATKKRRNQPYSVDVALRDTIAQLQLGENSGWAHNAVGLVDHEAMFKRVKHPVLLIGGEFDRGLLQGTRDAAPLLENGRYLEMPDTGGDVYDSKPEELADIVVAFLKEK